MKKITRLENGKEVTRSVSDRDAGQYLAKGWKTKVAEAPKKSKKAGRK